MALLLYASKPPYQGDTLMAILRISWSFWRSLTKDAQSILLERYEIHTVSDETWKQTLHEIHHITGKAQ